MKEGEGREGTRWKGERKERGKKESGDGETKREGNGGKERRSMRCEGNVDWWSKDSFMISVVFRDREKRLRGGAG